MKEMIKSNGSNLLKKQGLLNSPVVEQTPVIWHGRLCRVEVWQTHWDNKDNAQRSHYVRIVDHETGDILGCTMHGYGLASAIVWNDTLYIFASHASQYINADGQTKQTWSDQYMTSSRDLKIWSDPIRIIEQETGEHLFNQSVHHDGRRFVMAYESDVGVHFTIKFAVSDDLSSWRKVDGGIYGFDKYAACPCIRYCDGWYYMLYLEHLKPRWWFETYLTRSGDLMTWEDAPHNPVIDPNPDNLLHATVPQGLGFDRECNASDSDIVEFDGKTWVFFTGGCQKWSGNLQYATYDGSMCEFFAAYYK